SCSTLSPYTTLFRSYMKVFNKERNAHLKPVVAVPSVPAAIFSDKYSSLDAITPKMKIAIPQDPSNAARAYNLLAKAGWITLKERSEEHTSELQSRFD